MKCPKCAEEMTAAREDTSYNTNENNKPYERIVYQCVVDDVWVTTEIPESNNAD